MEEIKRKKLLFKCSRTTAEGRASPAELRLSHQNLKSPKWNPLLKAFEATSSYNCFRPKNVPGPTKG